MKRVGLLFLVFLFSFSLISALDLSMSKTSFYSGETIQVEVEDTFIDTPKVDNFGIYLSGGIHKTPVQSQGLVKLNERYVYYAILPEVEGSYSVVLEGVRYSINGKESNAKLIKNFSIITTNSSYFSVSPGAIYTSTNVSIKVKAYNAKQDIVVSYPPADFSTTFNIGNGVEKTVFIDISKVYGSDESVLSVNSYSIPIIVLGKDIPNDENPNTSDSYDSYWPLADLIQVEPSEFEATLLSGYEYPYKINISTKINNISLDLNITTSESGISVYPNELTLLNSSKEIDLKINLIENTNGWIKINYLNESIKIPIKVIITTKVEEVDSTIKRTDYNESCASNNGKKCNNELGEECSGTSKFFTDGACCIGDCIIPNQASSGSWVWGVLILALLGVVGFVFYSKYKKNPSLDSNPLNQRIIDAKKRFNFEPKEVRDNIGKI